ncbi:Uncharacterised protein [Bordetella pertussis]|nr:Uncharacterised protein [Bordetella pertussis]CFO09826.1 Uncharacterised protein [Bordetella pertussis]CFO75201.1 Uncharacterised protein [Bordetella pertussis]CFP62769.1 Uncharacterised protein [Bordetella pertussis]CFU85741.1 Uncharacterised protein [Bordetella pertussis]
MSSRVRSSGTPATRARPGTLRLFSRYVLRKYQAKNGPGRLVLSAFQNSRSNAGGVLPFR